MWDYPYKLLPFLPVWPIDFVVVPVTFMFVYQLCGSWRSFTIAIILVSLFYCFITEPLLVKYGFYALINWNYLYSFPIYIMVALSMRWLVRLILARQGQPLWQRRMEGTMTPISNSWPMEGNQCCIGLCCNVNQRTGYRNLEGINEIQN
jgi:hypothetical protein